MPDRPPPSYLGRNRRIILPTFLAVLIAGVLITLFETPVYRSVARVLPPEGADPSAVAARLMSADVASQARRASNTGLVKLSTTETPIDGGGGLGLIVDEPDPEDAARVASRWAAAYRDDALAHGEAGVQTVDTVPSDTPLHPMKLANIEFAALLGLGMAVILTLIAEGIRAIRRPAGSRFRLTRSVDAAKGWERRHRRAHLSFAFALLIWCTLVGLFRDPTYAAVVRLIPAQDSDAAAVRFRAMIVARTLAAAAGQRPGRDGYYLHRYVVALPTDPSAIYLEALGDDPKQAAAETDKWAAQTTTPDTILGSDAAAFHHARVPDTPIPSSRRVRNQVLVCFPLALVVLVLLIREKRRR